MTLDGMINQTMQQCLLISPSIPDRDVITSIATLAQQRSQITWNSQAARTFEWRSGTMLLDRVGLGDFSFDPSSWLHALKPTDQVSESLSYLSAIYPWDRQLLAELWIPERLSGNPDVRPTDELFLQRQPLYQYLRAFGLPSLAAMTLPAFTYVERQGQKSRSRWGLACTALPIETWAQQHVHLPHDLATIGITDADLRDPFDRSRQLHWASNATGTEGVLWSLGKNGKDDTNGRTTGSHGDDETWIIVAKGAQP